MSADLTKVSDSLSSMFSSGSGSDPSAKTNSNVLLITYKRSVTEVDGSPPLTPNPFHRAFSKPKSEMGHDDDLIAEELPEEVDEPCSPPTPPSAVTLADKPRRVCVSKSLSSGESWGSEEGREYTAANRRRTSLQQENRHSAAASESAKSEDEYGGSPDRRTIWRFHEEAEDCGGVRRRSEDWRTFANSWEADEDKEDGVLATTWDRQQLLVPAVPLASEDSDLGESADFESFSEDDGEDESKDDLTPTAESKGVEGGMGFLSTRSLRDRLRDSKAWSIRRSSEKEMKLSRETSPSSESSESSKFSAESRLSRLFSLRRSSLTSSMSNSFLNNSNSSNYNNNSYLGDKTDNGMPRLSEEEEHCTPRLHSLQEELGPVNPSSQYPPSLPLPPLSLKGKHIKRRCIINSLIESENNYTASLARLVYEYKGYLETTSPPVLSSGKSDTLFYRVPDILACHLQFQESLRQVLANDDQDDMLIGEVFVSIFSESRVLEAYADYINNFDEAMDLAKSEAKRRSAFADFLKVKQLQSNDRLGLFGLMVKPIQRFPQFIMIVQDLLKETPPGHRDRMAVQRALTTLECLTGTLNDRKRISEQSSAFKNTLRTLGSKLGRSDTERILLRVDEVRLLEFNGQGQVSRAKQRKLILLNDSIVCVSVSGRASELELSPNVAQERYNLKWSAPYNEIEIVDGPAHGTLARLTAGGSVSSKRSSLGRSSTPSTANLYNGFETGQAETLASEMADLMHDYDVMSRISLMLESMKCRYPSMNSSTAADILVQIQSDIRQKDEEMSYMDKCCLHLALRKKDRLETFTFQMLTPKRKEELIVELRLARLAMDPMNSPCWRSLAGAMQPTTRLPLFVEAMTALSVPNIQTEVRRGLSYTLNVPTPTRTLKPVTYVWTQVAPVEQSARGEISSSTLRIFSVKKTQQIAIKELGSLETGAAVNALVYVPRAAGLNVSLSYASAEDCRADQVWVAEDDNTIVMYAALEPEKGREVGRVYMMAKPVALLYQKGSVWVGLGDGSLYAYRRGLGGVWDTGTPKVVLVGPEPVVALLSHAGHIFAATHTKISVVDPETMDVVQRSRVPSSSGSRITAMVVAGVGLWVAVSGSSRLLLIHTETLAVVSELDVLDKLKGQQKLPAGVVDVEITALSAHAGLLWIGTSAGLALSVSLPRLGGVPLLATATKVNVSCHGHAGPVHLFLPVTQAVVSEDTATAQCRKSGAYRLSTTSSQDVIEEEPEPRHRDDKESNGGHGEPAKRYSSCRLSGGGGRRNPVVRKLSDSAGGGGGSIERRTSKTLPRGFSLSSAGECGESIYGLYEDLLNVQDYDCEGGELSRSRTNFHRSDPELNTIPYRVSTLDRRMTMKLQRPRSLDLSSWSVESARSSHTTSSSSDGSEKGTGSPSVSRNASFLSQRSILSSVSRAPSISRKPPPTAPQPAAKPKSEIAQQTVTTLMGGRGYVHTNGGNPNSSSVPSNGHKSNYRDATLVIWDQKA